MNASQSALKVAAGIVLLVMVPLAFVACGSDDDDDADRTAPAATAAATNVVEPDASPAAEESPAATPADETRSGGASTIAAGTSGLVDARGFSLYLFANDVAGSGTSACGSGCVAAWPPLLVDGEPTADKGLSGELGTITRDDGTTQVTYNGLPLYFFVNDVAAGDTKGAEIPNWSLAQP